MKYCKNCVMPSTRPGLKFDEDGVCQACKNFDKRQQIDWDKRFEELRKLADKYRRDDGYYDCLIPVSGGKDSHFLVHTMTEELDMNPLLVSVADPFTKTEAGKHNLENLEDTFDCDHISFNISRDTFCRATRAGFEEFGEPLMFVETAIYTMPIKISREFNIPFMIYGENPAFEFGTTAEEQPEATDHIMSAFENFDMDWWLEVEGIDRSDLNPVAPMERSEFDELEPIFLSYFKPWNGYKNYRIAQRYGFKDVKGEWERPGHIEDYDQIDSIAYIIHNWMKYPKFGFMRTTDIASRWIRIGKITRDEAIEEIKKRGGLLDQRALEDFIEFNNYTIKEFYDIVNRHRNEDIFTYNQSMGEWELKDPIYKK